MSLSCQHSRHMSRSVAERVVGHRPGAHARHGGRVPFAWQVWLPHTDQLCQHWRGHPCRPRGVRPGIVATRLRPPGVVTRGVALLAVRDSDLRRRTSHEAPRESDPSGHRDDISEAWHLSRIHAHLSSSSPFPNSFKGEIHHHVVHFHLLVPSLRPNTLSLSPTVARPFHAATDACPRTTHTDQASPREARVYSTTTLGLRRGSSKGHRIRVVGKQKHEHHIHDVHEYEHNVDKFPETASSCGAVSAAVLQYANQTDKHFLSEATCNCRSLSRSSAHPRCKQEEYVHKVEVAACKVHAPRSSRTAASKTATERV